eukprot:1137602-Pelagomonas_calceolata.AAC.5
MPDLSSPGGMLAAEGKAQTSSMGQGNAHTYGRSIPPSHPISLGSGPPHRDPQGRPSTAPMGRDSLFMVRFRACVEVQASKHACRASSMNKCVSA